jgi:hypothetical protein
MVWHAVCVFHPLWYSFSSMHSGASLCFFASLFLTAIFFYTNYVVYESHKRCCEVHYKLLCRILTRTSVYVMSTQSGEEL